MTAAGGGGTGRIVVVGGSLAGLRAAQALYQEGYEGAVTVISAEALAPYDRPPLSKEFLGGTMGEGDLDLPIGDAERAEWRYSTRAVALDVGRQEVTLDSGEVLAFDGLVIATGAAPRTLPGMPELDGVFVLRTRDDCQALRARLGDGPRLAVVGGGFIGSEVAATAHGLGVQATVIEALPVPMVRGVGEEIGRRCARLHTDHNVDLRLGVGVAGLAGNDRGRVEAVVLADGSSVAADVVLIGVGVVPTTAWLDGSGIDVNNGVMCDSRLRVLAGGQPVPAVVAAGDVARWDNPRFGEVMRVEHWTNASEQGWAAAATLLHGDDAPVFDPIPYVWSDQYDTKIQFVGRTGPVIEVVDGSIDDDRFAVAYGSGGRLVGALAFSRPAKLMKLRALIDQGAGFPTGLGGG